MSAWVLGACALGASFLAGCDGEKPAEAPAGVEYETPSAAEYMKDAAFTNALAVQRAERSALANTRNKLFTQLAKMVDQQRAAMPGADDAAVKAELEKNPEWVSLQKRYADMLAASEDNRQKTMNIVRERTAPKKISK